MKKACITLLYLSVFYSYGQEKKWSLEDCIHYALHNNINIRQTHLSVKNAEVEKKTARGVFLPNINANLGHSWNTGLNTNPISGMNIVSTSQNSIFGVNANITLYDGLKNITKLHRANLNILANQYQLEDMKDNISLRIVNAYLQILFNLESLKTLKKQIQLTEKEINQTQILIAAGTKPKGEILEINAAIAEQEQQIITAKNNVMISKIHLTNLMQIENSKNFEILDINYGIPNTSILLNSIEEIYNRSLKEKDIVKLSQTTLKIAEDDLKISKGNYLPNLTASYGFGTNYFTSELMTADHFLDQLSDNAKHSFSLNLSIPIFNRYLTKNSVKQANIQLEKANLTLKQTKIDLKDKINQAYNEVQAAQATFKAAKKSLIARKNAFGYAKEKFEVGLLNFFNFNQAKTQYETTEIGLIKAKYDYIFKTKVLEYYFGVPLYKNEVIQ